MRQPAELQSKPRTAASTRMAFRDALLPRALGAVDDRSTAFAAAFGAAIVLLIAVPLSTALNIWLDEAYTLHSTGAGIGYAWQQAIAFEAQPPLYFVIEAAWRTFNEGSIAFARFPSAVFAAAAAAVTVGAARRITPGIPPLVVAAITAFNPLVIWAATEMRVYALVLLFGSLLTWTFYSGFLVSQRSRRAQALYVTVAILSLYSQYYIGFYILAQALTLLVTRREAVKAFAAGSAIVAAAFLPFVPIALQHVRGTGAWVRRASVRDVTHEIVVNAFVYLFPHDFDWTGAGKLLSIVLTVLLVALVGFGRPVIRDIAARGIVVQWIAALVIFDMLFLVAGLPQAVRRHMIVLAPSAMLIALLLLTALTRRRLLITGIALMTFAAFTAATLWTQYRTLSKTGDWKRVAATLTASPPAPVAVFPAELVLTLHPYLPFPIVAVPRPMQFTYRYTHFMVLQNEAQAANVLDPVRARSDDLWIVTEHACTNEAPAAFDYHCRYLEDYLKHRYRLVKTIVFHGSFARLFERNSEPATTRRAAAADVGRTTEATQYRQPQSAAS